MAPGCATPAATIRGTNGDDVLTSTPGADVIDALAGDDIVEGLGGNDVLIGGEGNDRLSGGGGDDLVLGGNGDDRLDGGRGMDRLCGENGIDLLLGGYGDDVLQGGSGADLLSGGPGDDDLAGGNGADLAAGGPGADKLAGDDGDDALGGNGGDDVSAGASGNDRISGGDGQDQAGGDKGTDRCTAEQTTGCEGTADAGTITASLSPATLVEAPPGYRLDWSASATAGVRLAELYADDQLVAHDVPAPTPESGGTFEVPVVLLPLWLLAVAVVGFRQDYNCVDDRLLAAAVAGRERPSAQELAVCRGPSSKAPFHGLTWPPGTTEAEWTVVPALVRYGRRGGRTGSPARASSQPASTLG